MESSTVVHLSKSVIQCDVDVIAASTYVYSVAMALMDAAFSLVFVFLLPPFVLILIFVLISASIGKSLGLRERYVKGLIRVFEVGHL